MIFCLFGDAFSGSVSGFISDVILELSSTQVHPSQRGQKPPETLLVHFHACLDHGVAAQLQVRALGFAAVLYKAFAHGKAQLLLQTQVCARQFFWSGKTWILAGVT